jgi:hypothetical protein
VAVFAEKRGLSGGESQEPQGSSVALARLPATVTDVWLVIPSLLRLETQVARKWFTGF